MHASVRLVNFLAALGAFAAIGCTGTIPGGPGGNGNNNGNTDPTKPDPTKPDPTKPDPMRPTPPAPAGTTASAAPLRRLNADQYRNTVADLLGIKDAVPASALPADESIDDRFISNVVRPVQGVDVERYGDAAEALARTAVMNLNGLMGCDPAGGGEQACVAKFIESFGKRAYRRPLTQPEIDRAKALYTKGRMGADAANGVRLVVQAMLQSVNFLYMFEPAPANSTGKVVAIDPWAMASRLSYFFLNSMPDAELFTAAESNQLSTAEQVAAQANRLVSSSRFLDTLGNFHDQWLELSDLKAAEKDDKLFPTWNDALRTALREETRQFVAYVLRQGDGKLETLIDAKFSMLSGPLFDHYGVAKPAGGTEWTKVDLKPGERAGLLTQAGLMASLAREDRTSYIRRGKLVRDGFLCTKVPDPPPGVDASEATIPATTDARERAKLHRTKPECAACHELFDPLGFAFEKYDAVGKYRTMENGKVIDTSSAITATTSLNGSVKDAVELAQKLATSDEVRNCIARQWMRFGLGREESPDDDASLTATMKGFEASGYKLADLVISLAKSDTFRYQKVKP
ncbi:MAG TPA: DUF1592 domain-containing protein [Polyangia bacterium]|nr:DUF1592 domain-containing protein [Polyangia bacterium]